MQESLLHRHGLIDFDPAVLANVPDLDHPNELPHELDDIKVKYHPHSECPSTIHQFSDFSCCDKTNLARQSIEHLTNICLSPCPAATLETRMFNPRE
jgi:hypothetical protein